jgi:gliding motility-associated-like protein
VLLHKFRYSMLDIKKHKAPFLQIVLAGILCLVQAFSAKAGATSPDGAVVYRVLITIIRDFALADGTQADVVTVNVTSGGVPVYALPVTFVINGGASGINPVIYTDVNGNAILSLSSTVAGPVPVQATVGGVSYGPVIVTFIASAGPPDLSAPRTQLIIDQGQCRADGLSVDQVHAHLVDQWGNPVSGFPVTFSVVGGTCGGTAVLSTFAGTTDVNGDAVLTLTNIVAGSTIVSAQVGGVDLRNSPATVLFIAGPPSVGNPATKLIVDIGSTAADGVSTDQAHAHVVDVNGNPVANATVVFTVSGGTAGATAVISGTGVTDVNGDATVTITNTTIGTAFISATIGGVAINNSPVTVSFVSGPPSTSNPATALLVDVGSNTADGVSNDQVHAHIVDGGGNPVPNATVVFAVTGGTSGGSAVIAGTGITDASGNAVLTITNTVAGTVVISATIGGVAINNSPATVVFVAGAPSPGNPATMLVVDVPSTTADGVSTDQVHAHAVDANGNAVPGATVVFTISGGTSGGTAIIAGTGITDASGNAVLTITNTVAGTVFISATVGGTAINGSPGTVTFVAGSPAPGNPSTALIVDVASNTADGVSTDKVHAHVVDASGNVVAGATVVFAIGGGTAGATAVIAGTGITDAGGDAALTITDVTAGTVFITATIGGTAINNSPSTVTFVAGAPDLTKSSILIDQNNSQADGSAPDIVHAHIVDANGNAVSGVTVDFTIASGAGSLTGPASVVTDANGNASISITSTVAGSVGVAAQDGGTALSNSPVIVNFANLPDVTNPLTALITVIPEALADGTSTTSVKAHIVDQSGVALPGVSVTFSIQSGQGQILTPQPVTTDVNGDAFILISSTTPGDVSITATVGGKPITFGSPAEVHFAMINIYVPKVFTPNGDGTNDVLKPILVGISSFHYFSVYNRWGNLLFTTQDPNSGWDGRVRGVPQPVETYLWIAEGVDMKGKKVIQKGMVSLIR